MKILVGIPAYNEETTIGNVIQNVPRQIDKIGRVDILVVDDGSKDKTAQIARTKGAKVLSHFLNRGLGGALKTIFAYADKHNYDMLITLDADNQHDPKDIKRFINCALKNKSDIIIGSRWIKENNAPKARWIVNRFANIITFLLVGIYTSDSQSGFRLFNQEAIKNIQIKTDGMEVSSEIFREIYKNKLKYKEIPIKAVYTKYSETKGQRLANAPDVLIHLLMRLVR